MFAKMFAKRSDVREKVCKDVCEDVCSMLILSKIECSRVRMQERGEEQERECRSERSEDAGARMQEREERGCRSERSEDTGARMHAIWIRKFLAESHEHLILHSISMRRFAKRIEVIRERLLETPNNRG